MSTLNSKRAQTETWPEPTWEVAHLFPPQGQWTEEEYLALNSNHLVELSDGRLEVLPMRTMSHQLLVGYLYDLLLAFVSATNLGTVLFAALRVRLWRSKICEPDVVFMRKEHADRMGEDFWKGADLVMEVVSDDPEDRRRDLEIKRREYAGAGIAEYWIVDPREGRILVLRLAGKRYVVHGEFARGAVASSHMLSGFTVEVTEALSRGAATRKAARPSRRRKRGT
jgi:Uma2 family endonuclease